MCTAGEDYFMDRKRFYRKWQNRLSDELLSYFFLLEWELHKPGGSKSFRYDIENKKSDPSKFLAQSLEAQQILFDLSMASINFFVFFGTISYCLTYCFRGFLIDIV